MTSTDRPALTGCFIDGGEVLTGGPTHKIINPATGDVVNEYALATPAEVDTAVAAGAQGARPATATPADRSAVLAKLAVGRRERRESGRRGGQSDREAGPPGH